MCCLGALGNRFLLAFSSHGASGLLAAFSIPADDRLGVALDGGIRADDAVAAAATVSSGTVPASAVRSRRGGALGGHSVGVRAGRARTGGGARQQH